MGTNFQPRKRVAGKLETGPLIHSDSRERKEGSESGERENGR